MTKTPTKKTPKPCPMCQRLPLKPADDPYQRLPIQAPKVMVNDDAMTAPLKFMGMNLLTYNCGSCHQPVHWRYPEARALYRRLKRDGAVFTWTDPGLPAQSKSLRSH